MARRAGFTFIELLVALAIMVAAFSVVFTIFNSTLDGWKKGNEVLAGLHHGDFVMEQLVQALRSTAFFPEAAEKYGFHLEKGRQGGNPADRISWVTSSAAFMPLDSPMANGLHRLIVSVEDVDRGTDGFVVRAMPFLADPDETDEPDPWPISTRVRGLECRIWNVENERWEDDWEESNAIPSLVEVTLFVQPPDPLEPPLKLRRAVQIPIAPEVTGEVRFTEGTL
jgi:prepilin-type N-terminal cleavage/methylation domain-containing protein